MRCLIATPGADAPGTNSAVRAATRLALRRELEVYGAKRGWLGLLEEKFWKLKEADVGSIISRGGSVLGSTDSKIEPGDRPSHERIARSMKRFDLVVATGGLGSFAVLNRIYSDFDMGLTTTMYIPASVEGEFLNPHHDPGSASSEIHAESIGADTAANRAMSAIDCLRDQAFHSRTVFLVECVGSKSNFLPILVGMACGAHRVYLPLHPALTDEDRREIKRLYGSDFDPNYVDLPELVSWIDFMFEKGKRTYLLVILPHGVPLLSMRTGSETMDLPDYEEMITSIKPLEFTVLRVAEALDVHYSGQGAVQVRHVLLDDLQRGGAPTFHDRILGSLYGEAAIEEFLSVVNTVGIETRHRGNLNLLAIENAAQVAWKCHPREDVLPLFQGKNPRAGGLQPLPFFRQARGIVSGYRPFATL